jgi:glycosyltransferase involved in cell wall biosynthesis
VVGWFGDTYDLKYFSHCDSFFGVTPDIVAHVVSHGVPAERALLTNTFGTMPDSPPVDRAGLGVPAGATLLLVLARLHPVKGIDIFLRALADIPGLHAWIAGEGPERAGYERLSRELGLGERVRFLGWRNDRKSLLAACDVVVLPSRYEPFGTVILEAWAMRRPLVATRADGARQYVQDGETGLLCAIDDAPGLAACLRRVAADADLRRQLAEAGHRRYSEEFTREIVLGRLLAAYETARALGKRE